MKPTNVRPKASSRKLPRHYTPIVFAFYMAAIMALLMCCTIVAIQSGIGPAYWASVLKAYLLAMPVAFGCVLLVRPVVMRLVARTVQA